MESDEINKNLLFKFLISKGAFFNYIDHFTSLDNIVSKFIPSHYFSFFDWSKMKEGTEYWMTLHIEWNKFYAYNNERNI